ncbi:hypothetical protein [Tomitella gaofuii]|uniref:hypothetical protein n=1 Tax=Tomitella gaofuii TaxID=2760083 RepID=UPI0015F9CF95|nr:hypothetical protein [Tomitella gaofuii]
MDRDDAQPGGDATLGWLYAMVEAAEEADLIERVDDERRNGEFVRRLRDEHCVDVDAEDESTLADGPGESREQDPDEEPPWSAGQVVGMIEHLLGATEVWPGRASDETDAYPGGNEGPEE